MLEVQQITGGYDGKTIVGDVSFRVDKGQIVGILGPNGSGKSTLLKIISGVLPATSGHIIVDGANLASYSTKELARKMAVLPQLHANAFSNTVKETVALGRYPHQKSFFASWSAQDEEAVQNAMAQTAITRYQNTHLTYMSGGEQQRAFIAQALAQCAGLLLLDEPTNHLDIAHQQQILNMIRTQATQCGLAVVSVFHDINLAALYCDELLLMEKGRVKAFGKPHEVVVESVIEEVYGARVATYAHHALPKPQITQLPQLSAEKGVFVTVRDIQVKEDHVQLHSPVPLKVVSSAVSSSVQTTIVMQRGRVHTTADGLALAIVAAGNIAIIINGKLEEQAFLRAIIKAVEVSVRPVGDITIAATQLGATIETGQLHELVEEVLQNG